MRNGRSHTPTPDAPTAIRCPCPIFDGEIPNALFYLFSSKKARLCDYDLSHGGPWICGRQEGQVPAGLLDLAQTVSHQESLVDEKTKIVRLQGHATRRLPVEQGHQFHRSRSPRAQIAHQKLARHARVHQTFHEQNVLPSDVGLMAEKNLHHLIGRLRLRLAVLGLDELA